MSNLAPFEKHLDTPGIQLYIYKLPSIVDFLDGMKLPLSFASRCNGLLSIRFSFSIASFSFHQRFLLNNAKKQHFIISFI